MDSYWILLWLVRFPGYDIESSPTATVLFPDTLNPDTHCGSHTKLTNPKLTISDARKE